MDSIHDSSSRSTSETDESELDKFNTKFVNLLKQYPKSFLKCQNSSMKAEKERELEQCALAYKKLFGKTLTGKQIQKKVSNLKTRIKAKTDLQRMGNRKVMLKPHERSFLEFLRTDDSPASKRICADIPLDDDMSRDRDRDSGEDIQTLTTSSYLSYPSVDSPAIEDHLDVSKTKYDPDDNKIVTGNEIHRIVLFENPSPLKVQRQEFYRREYVPNIFESQENFEINRTLLFEEF